MSERSDRAAKSAKPGKQTTTQDGDRTLVSRHSTRKTRVMGREGPVTVLIIDDEERNRRLLEVFLKADGYAVLGAPDGEEGLRAARTELPDAILVDLMMPGCDGFEVVRALKSDSRTAAIPLLIVSSLDDAASRARTRAAGAEELIPKPVDRWQLAEALRKVLLTATDGSRLDG